ncbi:hypothetical protein GGX14DRAFT_401002 [Mycena pura]|uniref:Uncharacterized protein n=1 Tax=Mycena pura TaxID=153505 RepID=A0AAD6V3T8_9AGAR|nr:hypothetical protein GGX14DRAFT_401002 [Mycena pura]
MTGKDGLKLASDKSADSELKIQGCRRGGRFQFRSVQLGVVVKGVVARPSVLHESCGRTGRNRRVAGDSRLAGVAGDDSRRVLWSDGAQRMTTAGGEQQPAGLATDGQLEAGGEQQAAGSIMAEGLAVRQQLEAPGLAAERHAEAKQAPQAGRKTQQGEAGEQLQRAGSCSGRHGLARRRMGTESEGERYYVVGKREEKSDLPSQSESGDLLL